MTDEVYKRRIEQQLQELTNLARILYAPAGGWQPTTQTLEQKKDARLYREAWESLTPEQRKDFEAQQGSVPTMRRLAEEARKIADSNWEKRELEQQAKQDDSNRWNGDTTGYQHMPGADYDQLIMQAEALEKKRAERLTKREERLLRAEDYDEEQPRILAGMDDEEAALFMKLMRNQPTPLQALQSFLKSQQPNPIANVTDSGDLYQLGEQQEGLFDPAHPYRRYIIANETDALYDEALQEIQKGE